MLKMMRDIKRGRSLRYALNIRTYWRYEMNNQVISRKDAISQGLKRYFTGEPCKHGHISERYVCNNRCYSCHQKSSKTSTKKWFNSNKDHVLKKNKEYYISNREKIRAQQKEYHKEYIEKNKSEILAYQAEYRKNNKEKLSEVGKSYYSLNKDNVNERNNKNYLKRRDVVLENQRRYRQENKDKVLVKQRNRRARLSGNAGTHTEKEINDLLLRQKNKCANPTCRACIKKRENRHLDHVIPVSSGGRNDIGNLAWLCVKCNLSKGAKDPIVWAQKMGRLL